MGQSWAGSGSLGCSDFSLAVGSLCSLVLTWKQRKEYLMLLVPLAFVVAHLLLNRYKLLVLDVLTAPSPH